MKVGVESLKRKKAEEGATPVDFDTLIIILAEIEKNTRNLSGMGRLNRQIKELTETLDADRIAPEYLAMQFSDVIRDAIMQPDYESAIYILKSYYDVLQVHFPLIPLEDDTLEK